MPPPTATAVPAPNPRTAEACVELAWKCGDARTTATTLQTSAGRAAESTLAEALTRITATRLPPGEPATTMAVPSLRGCPDVELPLNCAPPTFAAVTATL